LKGYDYSQQGMYFVTVCTNNHHFLFGHITEERMILNNAGRFANKCWLETPEHFPHVALDEFIVMPNHIHGIIIINDMNVYNVWQRNYYEHIIRNEKELNKIREYIMYNPLKWLLDRKNPDRKGREELEDEIFGKSL
ncbi:MAG: transposase, partial [Candidatus Scalindua sp.]